ncbi:MAG TPA: enoyl-CoA hydratase-related protein, partial [Vineibacter sp.]|nr:enoyl-CoA hydratase-related protein [Vineibacter sp.]
MLDVQGTDLVAIDRPAASVARIAINRPERRNALNPTLREKLADTVTQLTADPSVRAIVLTGTGGHFCAGGDLDSLSALPKEDVGALLARGHRLLRTIMEAGKPVVAAVEGAAAGGGAGLALAADPVVMGRGARFVLPFFRIGLVPDYGVVHALVRRAGIAATRR